MNYPDQFAAEDRERIFRFFAFFSRLEYSLKRSGFVRKGRQGEASADWAKYAASISDALAAQPQQTFTEAAHYLLSHPPKRLELVGEHLRWMANPKRTNEGGAEYLLRVVRDVRNNLFHGGKFPLPNGGPVLELARDRRLIDCASVVLTVCLHSNDEVERFFEEAA